MCITWKYHKAHAQDGLGGDISLIPRVGAEKYPLASHRRTPSGQHGVRAHAGDELEPYVDPNLVRLCGLQEAVYIYALV